MNTKTITPIHVCDLIAHETVSLLSVLDEDAVPPAQWMRDGLALYAAAHQLEEETARHLNFRVVIREIAPPVFTTSHKKPTEAKTSGDRRQSVL